MGAQKMNDLLQTIIITTYSTLFPALVGLVIAIFKENRTARKTQKETMQELADKIQKLTTIVEDDIAMTSRYRIIRYDDEELHGVHHSADHKAQIMEDCNIYKSYCDNHPNFVNHKGQNAMNRIMNDDVKQEYKKEDKK